VGRWPSVCGWTQQGPPYRFRGALYFDGTDAPGQLYQAPRQDFGPPLARTVGHSGRPELEVADVEVIPFDEAVRRIPDADWPDHGRFEEIRFYDGDLHVADVEELLDGNDDYAVAIRGDLIVDGVLDAVAGGDGYGSLLVVSGDVWARAAIFRYGIAVPVGGTFEVATVVLCSHGDDGGSLMAKAIRPRLWPIRSTSPGQRRRSMPFASATSTPNPASRRNAPTRYSSPTCSRKAGSSGKNREKDRADALEHRRGHDGAPARR
jgi:hypothetical protein